MAPAGVKRKRLNHSGVTRSSNGADGPRGQGMEVAPQEAFSPEEEDDSEDDTSPQSAGASYGALMSSLKQSNGHRRAQTTKRLANRLYQKQQESIPPQIEEIESTMEGQDGSDDAEEENSDKEDHANGETGGYNQVPSTDDEEREDASDPFEAHFANPDDNELSRRLEAVKARKWSNIQTLTTAGKQNIMTPALDGETSTPLPSITSLQDIALKQRLIEPSKKVISKLDAVQAALFPSIFSYRDLLYCGRTPQNADSLRNTVCLQALKHVFKTRDRIIKNTSRLSKNQGDADLELRDQGFTRPKVLILLETRHSCSRYMDTITKLCDPEQQENKKRFQDAFAQTEATLSEDKPPDFRELFEGNDDNEFRLGVKFTRKTLKYYSQFYSSDIILASPLGLRRAIKADEKSDYDFLSSIEMVVVDQADAMLMQNWEHVEFVFEHLNLQPKDAHDCDFSRVRHWYLDQSARYLRQTIVFSAFLTPELNGLFSSQMQNIAGKVKLVPEYGGVIQDVGLQIRQTFCRFRSKSPASDPDDRFKYFTSTVIPQLTRQANATEDGLGALIFIPSYLDFVRVRNHFSTSQDVQTLTFGSLSEYTDLPAARRGRSHFSNGKQSVMLYTGRAHHFRRYRIRGVKRVVLYGLPENPLFFNEIAAGFLGSSIAEGKLSPGEATVRIMFSRWDSLALERIVGGKRAGRMLNESGGDTFEFR